MAFPGSITLSAAVLVPTAAIIAYGVVTSINLPAAETAILQANADRAYVLIQATPTQALFRTPDGISLAMVGTQLTWAGRVTAIEQQGGLWTVRTSRNVIFSAPVSRMSVSDTRATP